MPERSNDHTFQGVFYVGRVPDIEFRDEAFHVTYKVGKCRFEFALPPSVFTKARLLSEDAVAKWRCTSLEGENVTPIRKSNT